MKELVLDLNDKVINGEMSALRAYIILKELEKLTKQVLEGLQEDAIDEAEKYGKGEHEAYGAKFQVRNGATRWNFKKVPEWQIQSCKLKALEDQLKSLAKAGVNVADTDTGEEIVLPEAIYGATTLSVKI